MPDGGAPSSIPAGWDWQNPDYDAVFAARAARIRYLREHPHLLPALRQHYAEDWVSFINDWAVTVDPRNREVGRPTTVPFLLFPLQAQYIEWLWDRWERRENGLVEKSRDSGATWLSVWFGICMWLFMPGAVIGFGSRKEEYVDNGADPKSIFQKVREGLRYLPVEFMPPDFTFQRHSAHMRVINPHNGAAIIGEAGANIGRGNRTSIYIVDEAAFLEHPEATDAALSETTNCQIHVSTPNGTGNPFYAKRVSGKWPVFTFHWRDDPRKGEAWYSRKVATTDPVIVAQEIDVNYEASVTNQLIPGRLVDAAQGRGVADVSVDGPRILSLDVARFGHCESVLTLRKNRAVIWQRVWRGIDTVDLAGAVRREIEKLGGKTAIAQIAVDDVGVGGGVTDQLRRWYGRRVKAVNGATRVNDGVHYNLRAKMYDVLLEWLRDEPNSLPRDPKLKSQLCSVRKLYRGGLLLLMDKDQMMREGIESPDRADSLALSFAYPVENVDDDDDPIVTPFEPLDRTMGY